MLGFGNKEEGDFLEKSQKKVKKSMKEHVANYVGDKLEDAVSWVRPDDAPNQSIPITATRDLTERVAMSNLFHFADISEDGMILSDDGHELRLGFMLEYSPFTVAGTDAETQIESVITLADTPGTVFQFGVLGNTEVLSFLTTWEESRKKNADSEVIAEMVHNRADFFRGSVYSGKNVNGEPYGYSLIQGRQTYPKRHNYFLTVMVPFKGGIGSSQAWDEFVEVTKKLRSSIVGALSSAQVHSVPLNRAQVRHTLRVVCNPHQVPEKLRMDDADFMETTDFEQPFASIQSIVEKDTRVAPTTDGKLKFESSVDPDDPRKVYAVPLTVDRFPEQSYLPQTAKLMGDLTQTTQSINKPFWMYTNVTTLDSDSAKDRFTMKMARVTRQLVSDSPAYQAFMSHLFEMRDQLKDLTMEARAGHMLVGAYVGINLFTDYETANEDAQAVASMWRKHGFETKPEKYIHFPVYMCSIPGHFRPEMDPLEKRSGLQRIMTMTSFQSATLTHMQGEWRGCSPERGGIPLISRRGELATIDVQDKNNTNYNFTIVADSGSGKSFFAQDVVMDFLSKGGFAYIIDAGRSYFEFVEQMGGVNLVFKVNDPLDLNPFADIKTEDDLKEMMELLKETIRYMAWPNESTDKIPSWQYTILERAIEEAWRAHREDTTIVQVGEWLANYGEQEDHRAKDIADQLRPYTVGRLSKWFNGEGRKVNLKGKLVCLEMDDLKTQGTFRDVALTLMMQRIADAMYQGGDPSIPKLLLIDEAWDLLQSNQAGPFINRAYRTYRKYGGSAGIITQKFGDLEMSEAAKAAYANSAWLFMLKQKPESLVTAFEKRYLSDDEYTKKLAESVHTIPGKFSEVYVKCDMGAGVYRFIVDPFTYWLYTTDKDDKAARTKAFEQVQKDNPDMDRPQAMAEALRSLASSRFTDMMGTTPEKEKERLNKMLSL